MIDWIKQLDPYTAHRLFVTVLCMVIVAIFWFVIRTATDHSRKN